MKAHLDRARPAGPAALPRVALLWGIPDDSPALGPLRAAERLGLSLRRVDPAEQNATTGRLCGIPGAGAAAPGPAGAGAPALEPAGAAGLPALVLCGLPEAERDALLEALRQAGALIPLKAIVTPVNQSWRFGDLLAELAREHAALQRS